MYQEKILLQILLVLQKQEKNLDVLLTQKQFEKQLLQFHLLKTAKEKESFSNWIFQKLSLHQLVKCFKPWVDMFSLQVWIL